MLDNQIIIILTKKMMYFWQFWYLKAIDIFLSIEFSKLEPLPERKKNDIKSFVFDSLQTHFVDAKGHGFWGAIQKLALWVYKTMVVVTLQNGIINFAKLDHHRDNQTVNSGN